MERKNTDSFSSVSVPGPVRIEANITYTNIGIDLRFQTVVPSTEVGHLLILFAFFVF